MQHVHLKETADVGALLKPIPDSLWDGKWADLAQNCACWREFELPTASIQRRTASVV
jgi:hypothetical protein